MSTNTLNGQLKIFNDLKEQASQSINSLASIADRFGLRDSTASGLLKVKSNLDSDTFKIILIGRFRNGKSTLLNALLGKPTKPVDGVPNDLGPMPVDEVPTTARVSSVVYSTTPFVRMWPTDQRKKPEEWSFKTYLENAKQQKSQEETQNFFKAIRGFEIGFPSELCKLGVTLIDSPGTADKDDFTDVTSKAVRDSDVAIVVFFRQNVGGQDELNFVQERVRGTGISKIFTVINMDKPFQNEDRSKAFIWNRLSEAGYLRHVNQTHELDFAAQDIYFVNAKQALDGKLKDSAQEVAASGLHALEQKLGEFLTHERPLVHLERFVNEAKLEGERMIHTVRERRSTLVMEQAQLETVFKGVLEDIRKITERRDRIEAALITAQEKYKQAARTSLREAIVRIGETLNATIPNKKFSCNQDFWGKFKSNFSQMPMVEEASSWCREIIDRELTRWQGKELAEAVKPSLQEMEQSIKNEVKKISEESTRIRLKYTTSQASPGELKNVVGLTERIVAGGLGLLVGNFSTLLGAGGGGLPAVGGGLVGQGAALGFLLLIGVTAPIIVIPTILISGLIGSVLGGGESKEKRVKEAILHGVKGEGGVLQWLNNYRQEAEEKLTASIDEAFKECSIPLLAKVDEVIAAESSDQIRKRDDNKKDRNSKAALDIQYQKDGAQIEEEIRTMNRVLQDAKFAVAGQEFVAAKTV